MLQLARYVPSEVADLEFLRGPQRGPALILMMGESGSGKTTIARELLEVRGDTTIRLNRDELRLMALGDLWNYKLEEIIKGMETESAHRALSKGYNVIVDDTNVNPRVRAMWLGFAQEWDVNCVLVKMKTPFEECLRRDEGRSGKQHIGRAVIERQFLQSGRLPLTGRPIVILDIDGTVADHKGIRSPFDETRVHLDRSHAAVVNWACEIINDFSSGPTCGCGHLADDHYKFEPATDHPSLAQYRDLCKVEEDGQRCSCRGLHDVVEVPKYELFVVSGRHDTCCEPTIAWLYARGIRFAHIFMRRGSDNRSDVDVKREILEAILALVPKEQIAFVIDDRPRVVEMWRENGLHVYPVRGTREHRPGCRFTAGGFAENCPDCGALEDF